MRNRFLRTKVEWVKTADYAPKEVAGVQHANRDGSDRQAALSGCRQGTLVTFRRESDNPVDPNAVALFVGRSQIGYLRTGRRMGRAVDRFGVRPLSAL